MDALVELLARYGWTPEDVATAVHDRFYCVYCGVRFLDGIEAFRAFRCDHILPPEKYPELSATDSGNMASACETCVYLMNSWDPNTGDGQPLYRGGESLPDELRKQLIERAIFFMQQRRSEFQLEMIEMWRAFFSAERSTR